jgi:hypothetical protein
MQEILVCIEYFVHDTLYICSCTLIFVFLDLHTPLTYWMWISTPHPLIYNPLFLFIFLFVYVVIIYIAVEGFCTWKLLRVNLYTFIRPNQEQL